MSVRAALSPWAMLVVAACSNVTSEGAPSVTHDAAVDATPPVLPPSLAVRQVAAGLAHTCALTMDGTVRCWGDNAHGQLGNGLDDELCTHTPLVPECSLRPNVVVGLSDVAQIAVSSFASCALRTDGAVFCWGATASGEEKMPTPVAGLPASVVEVSVGASAACARTLGGDLWCWGNDFTEPATFVGPPEPHADPRKISGIDHAVQVSVGDDHVCVRIDDGTVRCWGYDTSCGLLQPPDAVPGGYTKAPVVVPGVSDAIQVSAASTTAILRRDHSILWSEACDPLPPNVLASIHDTTQLSIGALVSCTIDADRHAHCLGGGPVGDGTRANHYDQFVDVVGLAEVEQISAGASICAVVTGGQLWCWGSNRGGQVGDGTTHEHDVPTLVRW